RESFSIRAPMPVLPSGMLKRRLIPPGPSWLLTAHVARCSCGHIAWFFVVFLRGPDRDHGRCLETVAHEAVVVAEVDRVGPTSRTCANARQGPFTGCD